LIEDAYTLGERLGLSVWCSDQAGPFQTMPYSGESWQPEGKAACQPHEYLRAGVVKTLTLFHPADGQVRLSGVSSWTKHAYGVARFARSQAAGYIMPGQTWH